MAVTKCLYILQTAPWACTIYMYYCSSIKIRAFIYIAFYTITVHKDCSNYYYNTLSVLYILSRPGIVAVEFIRDRTRSPASIVGGCRGGRPREEVRWSCLSEKECCMLPSMPYVPSSTLVLRLMFVVTAPSSLSPRVLVNHRASAGRRPQQPEHERQR
jgi:hypothetical protein